MPSSHALPPFGPRSGRPVDLLEARLDRALRPEPPAGLEDRVAAASTPILCREASADARVGRAVARTFAVAVPPGLEERVHALSAGDLGRATAPALAGPRRGPRRLAAARAAAGRLAMAASFGVLAVLGWWATRPPAPAGPGAVPVERVLAGDVADVVDVSWASLEEVAEIESELALLEEWDVGSYADVEDEIAAMIPDFLLIDSGR